MSHLRSYLGKHVASGPKTGAEIKQACKDAYHRDGTICLRPEWFTSWADQQQLKILAEKQFGKRRGEK